MIDEILEKASKRPHFEFKPENPRKLIKEIEAIGGYKCTLNFNGFIGSVYIEKIEQTGKPFLKDQVDLLITTLQDGMVVRHIRCGELKDVAEYISHCTDYRVKRVKGDSSALRFEKRKDNRKYRFEEMEIGDSIPVPEGTKTESARRSATRASKALGIKLSVSRRIITRIA